MEGMQTTQIAKTHLTLPKLKAIIAQTLMSTPRTTNAPNFITCKPWMNQMKRLYIYMLQLSTKAQTDSTQYCKLLPNTKV